MTQLKRQVERILDEADDEHVEVIVQMVSQRAPSKLAKAAGAALSRRRFSLSPRDLLPSPYRKRITAQVRKETASTRTLLGKERATRETLALSRIKELGLDPTASLVKSAIVRAALARMLDANGKGKPRRAKTERFWTSHAMPLQLRREELRELTKEVDDIKAVHLNRRLSVPSTLESAALPLEKEEIFASTWGLELINALAAWGAHGARGDGITIGLLDTGVDADHPDLAGKVAHWAEFDTLGRPVRGSKPHDSDQHGTHCAGTLVGGNASGRFIGVAPHARLAAALVLDGKAGGTDAQVLAGIDWAVEQGIDVLSLSLGGLTMDAETPSTYTEAILTCVEAGIPVVAAIGNEGHQTTGSPGNDLFALSIGATDPYDRAAGFSGGRTQIIRESDFIDPEFLPLPYAKPDLAAPGVAVYSAVPGGTWQALHGTSMAAPHVAGAIALLLCATSIKDKEGAERRTTTIQDLITGSVKDLGESGQDHRFGFGRLDVLRAIDFAKKRGY